jgi:hypothetical protein
MLRDFIEEHPAQPLLLEQWRNLQTVVSSGTGS